MLSQVEKLIQYKGKPCLTVIIPTTGYSAMRFLNKGIIKKNLNKARTLLSHRKEVTPGDMSKVNMNFERLAVGIDTKKLGKGVGIFVSPDVAEILYFPFDVHEMISMADSFETRNLFYYREFSSSFYVLMLAKNKINLYRSQHNELKELMDSNFPALYVDDHQYAKPSRGTSFGENMKSYEKDKLGLAKERMHIFFKETDRFLHKYLKNQDLIILCGPAEETSAFMRVTEHRDLVAGTLAVSHHRTFSSEMISKFHQTIFNFKIGKQDMVIRKLDEDFGDHRVVEGLEEVWKAAHDGKGLLLAVEKDYRRKAYFKRNDEHNIHTFPPNGEYQVVADAVDNLIQTVREKRGKIVFVENEGLKKYHHIAMVLRYKNMASGTN